MSSGNRGHILISLLISILISAFVVFDWVLPSENLATDRQGGTGFLEHSSVFAPSTQANPQDNSSASQVMSVMMLANGLIALSYASIPVTLVVFISKRKDIPFSWIIVLFSAFILACGTTHAMHVVGFMNQNSVSWGQAVADSLTAVVSMFSAIIIWPYLPKLLSFPSPAQLRAVNLELQQEKTRLEQTQNDLRRAYAEVEQRVAERTAELIHANQMLKDEVVERKHAQEALQKSQALLNETGEMAKVGGWEIDWTSQTMEWTGAVYRIHEVDEEFQPTIVKAIGFYTPESRPIIVQAIEASVEHGESFDLELQVITAKGNPRWVHVAGQAKKAKVSGVFQDITARKHAVEEREHLLVELERKNRDLESMMYIASHDLRSPLINIQGFGASLRRYFGQIEQMLEDVKTLDDLRIGMKPLLSESVPKALRFIETSSAKMDALINGLLRLSRIGRAQILFEPLDMNRLIQVILDTSAFQIEKVGAQIEVQKPLFACRGDRQQLNQVFSNLIDNAIKYRDKARPLVITISSHEEAKTIIYTVADNGVGIAAENLDKIWELFRRLEVDEGVPGEGLGLTIARRIIERHNGKIWAESDGHVGSRFHVELPA